MKRIYLDNSATSFPKPDQVTEAMVDFAQNCGASAGRGAYQQARDCGDLIQNCRQRIAELINAESPDRIVFAMNCSEALNTAIRGVLNTAPAGSHAIATALEHNSVLRPLNALADQGGLIPEFIKCDSQTGLVNPVDVEAAIRPETKMIACIHVSNVTGTKQPVEEICAIAKKHNILSVVDAAQSIGHVEVDVQKIGADFVAFPGHKGLLAPLGTAVLYIKPGVEKLCKTMKEGGTGTISEVPTQPTTMPDKYEIGSHNAIGIAGFVEGVDWVISRGVDYLRRHDQALCTAFFDELGDHADVTVYGPRDLEHRTGVFSVNIKGLTPHQLAEQLESLFGICTRPGIHCAPLAHETIGTHPVGTCRLSFGAYTTRDEVVYAAKALKLIADRVNA